MTNEELKAIAEDASEGKWQQDGFEVISDGIEDRRIARCSWLTDAKFMAAANPAAVLGLIADNDRLERKNANQAESIREYQDLVTGGDVSLGTLKADLRVTTGERDALKAECEGLRKDAERYRWLRRDTSSGKVDFCIMRKHWGADVLSAILELEQADQQIDAAMSKEASNG
jgi:hypothetical protein